MDKDTQLPAEVLEGIERKAQHYSGYKPGKEHYAQVDRGRYLGYVASATEYAKENAQLKRWKTEASEILNPILEYGQSKEADIRLGGSIPDIIIERCKQAIALQAKCNKYEAALKKISDKYSDEYFAGVTAREALSGDRPTDQEIEAEITRRWNSTLFNPEGIRTRESYRKGVIKDLTNQKEDKQ